MFTSPQSKGIPDSIVLSGQTVPLITRTNPRAKRLTMRWDYSLGQAIVTTPVRFTVRTLTQFIQQAVPWLEKQVNKHINRGASMQKVYVDGMILPILGNSIELRHRESAQYRAWWEENHLLLHAPADQLKLYTIRAIHQRAHVFLDQKTRDYAEHLGVKAGRITLRDTKSRWGSCSSSGNISYCWRLVLAPQEVAAYVCAHEVSHLIEMNHSPAFWNLVARLCPDHKTHRRWLRTEGRALHLF